MTEGIRPGVVACSHHMGRWRLDGDAHQQVAATVRLRNDDGGWAMSRKSGVGPYASSDPDTQRIWWSEVGVHQNLTFPVHPDPISGMHCWHQAVFVERAHPGDAYGDVHADTHKAHLVFRKWLALTRPAATHSPDGTRRPYWMLRPLKPRVDAYRLPPGEPAPRG